jgi:nucleoside-diphosphate-sugar epimerase
MKKVLVTGAAGTIGINVIKYLLSEGKYEITAVDLKNRGNYKTQRML